MSVVDSPSVDDRIYRATFDPATQPASIAILEAIEAAGVSVSPDVVLADSIDPDTLEGLYCENSPDSWMLTFDHAGIEITLWGSGRIHIDPTAQTARAETEARSASVATRSADSPPYPPGPRL